MALKVIGAGFGRTGTASLKLALETLGLGPCYHMDEIVKKPQRARIWMRAWDGDQQDWDSVFSGYQAAVDFPACLFYQQLIEQYPDAKVILTARDPEAWYRSVSDTIWAFSSKFPNWLRRLIPPAARQMNMAYHVIWNGVFAGKFTDQSHSIEVYRNHVEEVQKIVPSERLLVYEVKEGWQPLCAFLGLPVPENQPFPRLNETARFKTMIRVVSVIAALPYVLAAALIVLLVLLMI